MILMLFAWDGYGQNYQAGLRLGDPYGISAKTDLNENYAAEVIIGRGSPNSSQYYRRTFDQNKPFSSAIYDGQQVSGALSLQARLAYQESINNEFGITEGNLKGYAGLGVQLRNVAVSYFYHTPNPEEQSSGRVAERSDIDLGPEGFFGAAYLFADFPVEAFAEMGLLMELMNRLGHLKVQGAVGARYRF
ncbi:hypothetical protein SAMN04488057_105328 [Cyclobacterium lianum]|uniref:Outer membrane protein beta-barrel domain-containing protein n=2 Tax=Cyclobacterium lianum TaxID=388280 RepID=A0A1M7NIT2_9BACT|nr:hypothetical protein SAMN04488057_105328 [Cyclobacterium lianum]